MECRGRSGVVDWAVCRRGWRCGLMGWTDGSMFLLTHRIITEMMNTLGKGVESLLRHSVWVPKQIFFFCGNGFFYFCFWVYFLLQCLFVVCYRKEWGAGWRRCQWHWEFAEMETAAADGSFNQTHLQIGQGRGSGIHNSCSYICYNRLSMSRVG